MKKVLNILLFIVMMNFIVTGAVDWIINPSLTKMEIFLRTPQHFIWDFQN